MSDGISSGVSAMSRAQRRLEFIANNLANVESTGYKRRSSFSQALESKRGDGGHRPVVTGARLDFAQGALKETGNPYDLALVGEGFFAVEGPDGEVYTRDGSFSLGPDGVLLTSQGYPVAWESLTGGIDPSGAEVVIDSEGGVMQGRDRVGALKLVNFDKPHDLRQDGEGFFHATRGTREVAHSVEVRQGALESSNVNAMEEIIAMILVQRNFESAAKVVTLIADTYRRLSRQQ